MFTYSSFSAARIILNRTNPLKISALYSLSNQTHFSSLQISSTTNSSLIQSIKTGFFSSSSLRPGLLVPLRSYSEMASHSKKTHGSIHDFTVK
ncbi:hypothetical protein MKW94_011490, partial [Papaver nudicaule]|nr:hypothetical protein [Papaver nudicaule]